MRVTSVTTTLSAEDILYDLKTLVETKVPELTFLEVLLEENYIEIKGTFHKFITIPFLARVKVLSVVDNILTLRIERVKVLKVGIPKFILNIASKTAAKKAEEMGLSYADKALSVSIDAALQQVPHVKLLVEHFTMERGVLSLKLAAIEADIEAMEKEAKRDKEEEERVKRAEEERRLREFNRRLAQIPRTQDSYTNFRSGLMGKVPRDKVSIAKWAFALPDLYALAFRLLKDRRVSLRDKVIIGFAYGYPVLPVDLFPSEVPLLGRVDDIALLTFGTHHMLTKIPVPILVKHWQGDLETLKALRDNIDKVLGFTPGKTLDKAYGYINEALEKKKKSYEGDEFYLNEDGEVVVPPDFDAALAPVLKSE